MTAHLNLLVVINDILDFSKLSANKVQLEQIPVCLKQEVHQLELLFQVKGSSKDVLFEVNLDHRLQGKKVLTDPVRLNQVLNNLVSNAFKFTERGKVALSIRLAGVNAGNMMIQFSVDDTGIGISADELQRILSPFSQADTSTTRKFGGTGLGLSITKNLVELMGGELQIQSEKNCGAHFSFVLELPVAPDQNINCSPEGGAEEVKFEKLKVLLVEDNPMNQLYATAVLEDYCEEIIIANNGVEAIEKIREGIRVDLILMDIQMPEMGGERCTEIIRNELGLRLPVIALTANAFPEDKERYLKLGMNAYLSKPFKQNDFYKIISQVIKNQ